MPHNVFLVADKASVHDEVAICRILSRKSITLVKLPAYSYDLNPIEMVFAQVKAMARFSPGTLRTFAPIVSAHPYCARNSLRDVMPRHALSARAVEEMWRYIALVGTLISMHGFNSLKCSVTPYFLLIDHFLCRLSTFCEKLKKIYIAEV